MMSRIKGDFHSSLNLGIVGNCASTALINESGCIVWWCVPRFDGDPIFCSLLNGPNQDHSPQSLGFWEIRLGNFQKSSQRYIKNSSVLETRLWDKSGAGICITDFLPRFEMHGREFRPGMLIRKVTAFGGNPRIQVILRPTFGYGWGTPEKTRGSNHIRYLLSNMTLRLTTNAPVSYIVDEVHFTIEEPLYFVLMPDESLQVPIQEMVDSWLSKTLNHWWDWARILSIPFEWQEEVLRACISVKLGNFEETGSFIAAVTTSIPNGPTSSANYDYRFCWLRDAYWVVRIFCRLGATSTMENYLRFIANIVADFVEPIYGGLQYSGDGKINNSPKRLQPVYGISLEHRLHQKTMHRLAGYRGMGPVYIGSKDADTTQNDVYGSLIMALSQTFFDQRLIMQGDERMYLKLELLGDMAVHVFDKEDHGPQPTRKGLAIHTYSSVMCWVACDRLARIAVKLGLTDRGEHWRSQANILRTDILKNAFNREIDSFTSIWNSQEIDAFLLLLPEVGFIPANDPKFTSTLSLIESRLKKNGYILMQQGDAVAFNPATFWYVNILAGLGRITEAREVFENMIKSRSHLGMLSENIDPDTKELWGNFPQSSALIGLVDSALRLSIPWKNGF